MICPECDEEMSYEPARYMWFCPHCGYYGYEEDIIEYDQEVNQALKDQEMSYRNVYESEDK